MSTTTQSNEKAGMPVAMSQLNLRDYFAAKAMQAIIIGNGADECALGIGDAKDAYAMADAMLAARERT